MTEPAIYTFERPTLHVLSYTASLLSADGQLVATARGGLTMGDGTIIEPIASLYGFDPDEKLVLGKSLVSSVRNVVYADDKTRVLGSLKHDWTEDSWLLTDRRMQSSLLFERIENRAEGIAYKAQRNKNTLCRINYRANLRTTSTRVTVHDESFDMRLVFCLGLVLILPFGG